MRFIPQVAGYGMSEVHRGLDAWNEGTIGEGNWILALSFTFSLVVRKKHDNRFGVGLVDGPDVNIKTEVL